MQESGTADAAAKGVSVAQPCILVKGRLSSPQKAYLVVEKNILCEIIPKEAVVALMSAFYAFNMQYTPGCSNLYSFFERVFFDMHLSGKKQRVGSVLSLIMPHMED